MKIIISSARTMKENPATGVLSTPVFQSEAEELLAALRQSQPDELMKIWGIKEKQLDSYLKLLEQLNLQEHLTPAIRCYNGIVYKQLGPDMDMDYVNAHVRILSAFYGVLKPLDGIRAYRLEMAAPFRVNHHRNLYDYWSYRIYEECRSDWIINLASEEYGRCVRKYLNETDQMLDIDFLQKKGDQYVRQSTAMKKARGTFLNYMIQNKITSIEELKHFNLDGYVYYEEESTPLRLVFKQENL